MRELRITVDHDADRETRIVEECYDIDGTYEGEGFVVTLEGCTLMVPTVVYDGPVIGLVRKERR